jgi:hypothetical protein
MNMKEKLTTIREMYENSPAAKALFDNFATRQRNSSETTLSRLVQLLNNGSDVWSRSEIIDVLKELDRVGSCVFKIGRRGAETRAEWNDGIVSLGQAAAGKRDDIESIRGESDVDAILNSILAEPETNKPTAKMLVTYPLRRDLIVEVLLPRDITCAETNRLSEFFKSLRFDDTPGS